MADRDPVTAALPRVVTLPAEMDLANTDALGEQFAAALASGVPAVIADMSATTFCDSAGIATLIRANKLPPPTAPNYGCSCRAPRSCAS